MKVTRYYHDHVPPLSEWLSHLNAVLPGPGRSLSLVEKFLWFLASALVKAGVLVALVFAIVATAASVVICYTLEMLSTGLKHAAELVSLISSPGIHRSSGTTGRNGTGPNGFGAHAAVPVRRKPH